MIDNEKQLIQTILHENVDAFQLLVQQYQRLVSAVVHRTLSVSSDHEDLCQEVFLKVYRNLQYFRGDSKLSVWISRIAYTTCLNHAKKKSRTKMQPLDETDIEGRQDTDERFQSPINPEKQLEQEELAAYIEQELAQLPINQRTALTLYHSENLSYKEISEVMEIPENTLKSYIFRARHRLKEKMMQRYPEGVFHETIE